MTVFHLLQGPSTGDEEKWVDLITGASNKHKYNNILVEMSHEMEARNALDRYNDSKDPSALKGIEGLSIAYKIATALQASGNGETRIFTVGNSEDAMKRFIVKLVVTKRVSLRSDDTLLIVREGNEEIFDYIHDVLQVKCTKI